MTTIDPYLHSLFDRLPPRVRQIGMIGGGAIRAFFDGTKLKDIDVFFQNNDDYLEAVRVVETFGWYTRGLSNGRADLFIHPDGTQINLIGFAFDDAVSTALAFDFRCCQHVAWMQDGIVFCFSTEDAIADASDRILVVVHNNGTLRTLRRIEHYVNDYGYTVLVPEVEPEEDIDPDAMTFDEAHPAPPLDLSLLPKLPLAVVNHVRRMRVSSRGGY